MRKQKRDESSEYLYAKKKIDSFYRSSNKILSIVSSPYNSINIFNDLINNVIKENGRILYVCGEKKLYKSLISGTIIESLNLKFSLTEDSNSKLICLEFNEALYVKNDYYLIIVDEISSLYSSDKLHIKLLIDNLYNRGEKIISYSIDRLFNYGQCIEICDVQAPIPILEPRIITTRIDLNKDIPFNLYEYFKWFKARNRNVVIIVPNVDIYEDIIKKYINAFKFDNIKFITLRKESNLLKKMKFDKNKSTFIITNDISNYIRLIKNLDIVILEADKNIYSYKTIVYLSSIVARNSKESSELLLVANTVSVNMELAKNIVREFNKILWQKGLLNY